MRTWMSDYNPPFMTMGLLIHALISIISMQSPLAKDTPKAVLSTLQWRLNERNGVWNYQRIDCLLNRLFRRKSKKTSKFHATGLCEGNSPLTGEFLTQRTSSAENVSIGWRHHEIWVNHQQVDVMNVLANLIIACANADQYFDTSLRNSGTLR